MYLPESLLWCFYPDCDLSGVQIICDENFRKDFINEFNELFWKKYYEEVEECLKESFGYEDDDVRI